MNLGRLFPATAPPGPFRPGFFKSPLRGPWLTAILGSLLLIGMTIVALTGLFSHAAYEPDLGRNAIVPVDSDLPLLNIGWPAGPSWLYALNQGLHVTLGIVIIPLVLAKLWSVIPRLFAWPPVATPAMAIERLAIGLLVSSAVFQLATGMANIQSYYPFSFNFVVAHYYGGIVFIASMAVHVIVKMPVVVRAYRERGVLTPLRDDLAHTVSEPRDPNGLVAEAPSAPSITRRGLLGIVGAGSGLLLVATVGQSIGGPLRKLAFLAPRADQPGSGPNAFQVNKTAMGAGIKPEMMGQSYRLTLSMGENEMTLSREDLLALPQRTESLPIACVEGWSTTQSWTGVPIAELARMAGATGAQTVLVESLQPAGILNQATLNRAQFTDDRALLALKVNGADLSPDHGFPARIIVPALPGVHNTKWVKAMSFKGAA